MHFFETWSQDGKIWKRWPFVLVWTANRHTLPPMTPSPTSRLQAFNLLTPRRLITTTTTTMVNYMLVFVPQKILGLLWFPPFCKSSREQTNLKLSLDRAWHFSSGHYRGRWDEGCSFGGNLQPHCRMPLNPPHWTFNSGLEPSMLLELPHNKRKSLPLALNNYWLYNPHHVYFKINMVWKVYGHFPAGPGGWCERGGCSVCSCLMTEGDESYCRHLCPNTH